jgi:hypothetical protein
MKYVVTSGLKPVVENAKKAFEVFQKTGPARGTEALLAGYDGKTFVAIIDTDNPGMAVTSNYPRFWNRPRCCRSRLWTTPEWKRVKRRWPPRVGPCPPGVEPWPPGVEPSPPGVEPWPPRDLPGSPRGGPQCGAPARNGQTSAGTTGPPLRPVRNGALCRSITYTVRFQSRSRRRSLSVSACARGHAGERLAAGDSCPHKPAGHRRPAQPARRPPPAPAASGRERPPPPANRRPAVPSTPLTAGRPQRRPRPEPGRNPARRPETHRLPQGLPAPG